MIKIEAKKDCCGCGACENKCPQNCIVMMEDEEGFLYPSADEKKCVECGLCEAVCPVANAPETGEVRLSAESVPETGGGRLSAESAPETGEVRWPEAYACYCTDGDIRDKSSSGGMFSVFMAEVLRRGGVVFGAAFDREFRVVHVPVQSADECGRLRGSKYAQSRMGGCFREAEKFLEDGRRVLFSGTACQIAGLKRYLGREYENLFSIDVLCHGVPSPAVWRRYISDLEKKYGKSSDVSFRDKGTGWKKYSVRFGFENGRSIREDAMQNIYMRFFLGDICLRPSCHDCRFKSLSRPSDITLGDCWGVGNHLPDMDDDRGTSVLLLHTEKGKKLFSEIGEYIVAKKAEPDILLPPTADSRKSVKMHPKRKEFFAQFEKGCAPGELEALIRPSARQKMIRKVKSAARRISGK